MSHVVVVTDSTASIPSNLVTAFGILIAPQWVVIDGTPYRDGDIDCSALWKRLQLGSRITTAQPSPHDLITLFHSVASSADAVLVITIASRLSSTFHTADLAAARSRHRLKRRMDSSEAMNTNTGRS